MNIQSISAVILSAAALLCSDFSQAQGPSRFSLGGGWLIAPVEAGNNGLSKQDDIGVFLSATYAHSTYAGSRLMVYGTQTRKLTPIDDDPKPTYGLEMQLLLGYGLNRNGIEVHTGPAWHVEQRAPKPKYQTHTYPGWGWHLGVGYRYRAWGVELSGSIREPNRLKAVHESLGLGTPNLYTAALLVSYQLPRS